MSSPLLTSKKDTPGVKYCDMTAETDGGFVDIGDSQDTVVLTRKEAAVLRDWLNKLDLPKEVR